MLLLTVIDSQFVAELVNNALFHAYVVDFHLTYFVPPCKMMFTTCAIIKLTNMLH